MWPRRPLGWRTPMSRPSHILSRVPLPLTMERNHSPSLRPRICCRPQQPSSPTSICELLKRYDVATPTDQPARSVASPRPIKTGAGARCSDPGHVSMRPEQANGVNVASFLSVEEKSRSHSRSGVSVGERTPTVRMDRLTPVMNMKATIAGWLDSPE